MAVQVVQNSRLRFSDLVNMDGTEFWDLPDFPDIPEQPDDISYQVKSTDRIDLLANSFYGDPVLWWVIAISNGMELLPTNLSTGTFIRIPSPRFVLQQLFRDAKGR